MNRPETPLISVIIPSYNRLSFLQKLIPSLIAATPSTCEIIVSDDGSTDDTVAFIQQYPSITYIQSTNKGVSAARNRGAAIAKGDFLLFLDSDDVLINNWANAYLQSITLYPNAVAHFAWYTEHGKMRGHDKMMFFSNIAVSVIPGSYCVQKNIFNEIGGFDEALTHSENWEMLLRLCSFMRLHFLKSVLIKEVVLQYNSTYSQHKLLTNKQNKVQSYAALYHKHRSYKVYSPAIVAFFAHMVAINYAGLQKLQPMLVWMFKSILINSLNLKFYYKPLGIFIKRMLLPYPNTKPAY